MSRADAEQLIARGSWVAHFDVFRDVAMDGTVSNSVQIDPRLTNGRLVRVWTHFFSHNPNARITPEQEGIQAWRRRRG